MNWHGVRRTPWFRWVAAFTVFLIVSWFDGAQWKVALAYSAAFALVITGLFQLLDQRGR